MGNLANQNNQDLPLVTVWTLVFNSGKYVIESIESLVNQSYPLERIQHIIIDDGSSDDSVDILEEYISQNNYSCNFIKHDKNWGITSTLNQAIEMVKGKYCMGLSDDLLHPNLIEKFVHALETSNENVGLVLSNMSLINEKGILISDSYFDASRLKTIRNTNESFFQKLVMDYFIPAPACLYRTKSFLDITPYDESLDTEDYDFHLRFSRKYDFIFIDDTYVSYRKRSNSKSNEYKTRNTILMMQYAVLKHFNDHSISDSERDEIARLIKRNMTKSYYYGYGWLFRMKLYLNFFFKSKYKKIAFDYIRLTIIKVTKLRYKKLIGKNG